MLAAVAYATGKHVGVSVERMQTISIAGLPEELFTANMSATHIRYTVLSRSETLFVPRGLFLHQVLVSELPLWSECTA